ncbi:MAG: hypothetical protein M3R64_07480 [Pseudomonadota bacterium]|nr:hypothetical protein [Pseudomonadota bacterium]
MKIAPSPTTTASSTSQRVKVGLIGLAAIILLIAVASAVIGTASRERPIDTAGAAQPAVVADMAVINAATPSAEPMAELGVAPPTTNAAAVSPPHQ